MSISYTIKSGDTLSKIAKDLDASLEEIIKLNNIQNANVLKVGQVVKVPSQKYKDAIGQAQDKLRTGTAWGDVWNQVKSQFNFVDNATIDKDLGVEWREPGAYEKYRDKLFSTQLPEYMKPYTGTPTKGSTVQIAPQLQVAPIQPPVPKAPVVPSSKQSQAPQAQIFKQVDPFTGIITESLKKAEDKKMSIAEPAKKETGAKGLDITMSPWDPAAKYLQTYAPQAYEEHKDKSEGITQDPKLFTKVIDTIKEPVKDLSNLVLKSINPTNELFTTLVSKAPSPSSLQEQKAFIQSKSLDVFKNKINSVSYNPTTSKFEKNNIFSGTILESLKKSEGTEMSVAEKQKPDTRSRFLKWADPKGEGFVFRDGIDETDTSKELTSQLKKEQYKGIEAEKMRQKAEGKIREVYKEIEAEGFIITDTGIEFGEKLQREFSGFKSKQDEDFFNEYLRRSKDIGNALVFNQLIADVDSIYNFSIKDSRAKLTKDLTEKVKTLKETSSELSYYQESYHQLNEYNNTYAETVKTIEKSMDDYLEVSKKITDLTTPAIANFFDKQSRIDSLPPVEVQALFNFYEQNKKTIDEIHGLAQRGQDIENFININKLKAENAQKNIEQFQNVTEQFNSVYGELLNSKEFESLISLWGSSTGKSKIANDYKQYMESKIWMEKNDKKIIDIIISLEGSEKQAAIKMKYYEEYLQKKMEEVLKLNDEMNRWSKEVEESQLWSELRQYEKESLKLSGLLGPKSEEDKTFIDYIPVYGSLNRWRENAGIKETMGTWFMKGLEGVVETIADIYDAAAFWTPSVGRGVYGLSEKVAGKAVGGDFYKIIHDKNIKPSEVALNALAKGWEWWTEEFVSGMISKTHLDLEDTYRSIGLENSFLSNFTRAQLNPKLYTALMTAKTVEPYINVFDYLRRIVNIPTDDDLTFAFEDYDPTTQKGIIDKEEALRLWYANKQDVYKFKTNKQINIFEVLEPKNYGQATEVFALNDFAGKGIDPKKIPAGTEIVIPNWEQNFSMLNVLPPQIRIPFEAKHPIRSKVADELAQELIEPTNWAWPLGIMAGKSMARKILQSNIYKVFRESAEQASWAKKILNTGRITSSFSKMMFGKLPHVDYIKFPTETPFRNLFKAMLHPKGLPKALSEFATVDFSDLVKALTKIKGMTIIKELPEPVFRQWAMNTEQGLKSAAARSYIKTIEVLSDLVDEYNLSSVLLKELKDAGKDITLENIKKALIKGDRLGVYSIGDTVFGPKDLLTLKNIEEMVNPTKADLLKKQSLIIKKASAERFEEMANSILEISRLVGDHDFISKQKIREILKLYAMDETRFIPGSAEEVLAWTFLEKLGISDGTFKKMINQFPDQEDLLRDLRKDLYTVPLRREITSNWLSARYSSLDTSGRRFFNDLLNADMDEAAAKGIDVTKINWEDAYKNKLTELYTRYEGKDAALRMVKEAEDLIEDYRLMTQNYAKYYEEAGKNVLLGENIEMTPIDSLNLSPKEKEFWKNNKINVLHDPATGRITVTYDPAQYDYLGLQGVFRDTYFQLSQLRYEALKEITIGKIETAYKKTTFDKVSLQQHSDVYKDEKFTITVTDKDGKSKVVSGDKVSSEQYGGKSRAVSDFYVYGNEDHVSVFTNKELNSSDLTKIGVDPNSIPKGRSSDVKITDLLHTQYFGRSGTKSGWFNTLDASQQKSLKALLNNVVENPKGVREFQLSSKRDFGAILNDRAVSRPGKIFESDSYYAEFYKEYPNLDVFYTVATGLQDLFEKQPALYSDLYRQLDNLIQNKDVRGGQIAHRITAIDELTYFLMDLSGGKKPKFFSGKNFEATDILLRGKNITGAEIEAVISSIKKRGAEMAYNKFNKQFKNRLNLLKEKFPHLSDEQLRWQVQNEIKTTFNLDDSFNKESIKDTVKGMIPNIDESLDKTLVDVGSIADVNKNLFKDDKLVFLNRIQPKQVGLYLMSEKVPLDRLLPVASERNKLINTSVMEAFEEFTSPDGKDFGSIMVDMAENMGRVPDSRIYLPTRFTIKQNVVDNLYTLEVNYAKARLDYESKNYLLTRKGQEKLKKEVFVLKTKANALKKDVDSFAEINNVIPKDRLIKKSGELWSVDETKYVIEPGIRGILGENFPLVDLPNDIKTLLVSVKYPLKDGKINPAYGKMWLLSDADLESASIIKYLRDPANNFIEGRHFEVVKYNDLFGKEVSAKELKNTLTSNGVDPFVWIFEKDGLFDINDSDLVDLIRLSYDYNPESSLYRLEMLREGGVAKEVATLLQANRNYDLFYKRFVKTISDNPKLKEKIIRDYVNKKFTEEVGGIPTDIIEKYGGAVTPEGETINIAQSFGKKSEADSTARVLQDSTIKPKIKQVSIEEAIDVDIILKSLDAFYQTKRQMGWTNIVPSKTPGKYTLEGGFSLDALSRHQEYMLRISNGTYADVGDSLPLKSSRLTKEARESFSKKVVEQNILQKEIFDIEKQIAKANNDYYTSAKAIKELLDNKEKELAELYQRMDKVQTTFGIDSPRYQELGDKAYKVSKEIDEIGKRMTDINDGFQNKLKYIGDQLSNKINELDFSRYNTPNIEKINPKDILDVGLEIPEKPMPLLNSAWAKEKYFEVTLKSADPRAITIPKIDGQMLAVKSLDDYNDIYAKINNLLDTTGAQDLYPTVVDMSGGRLQTLIDVGITKKILPETASRIKILTNNDLTNLRFISDSLIPGAQEYKAGVFLKQSMIDKGQIWLFGANNVTVKPSLVVESFNKKFLNAQERNILKAINEAYGRIRKDISIKHSPGHSFLYPKYEKPVTMATLGLDEGGRRTIKSLTLTAERLTSRVNVVRTEQALQHMIKRDSIEAAIRLADELVVPDSKVLIVSGNSSFLSGTNKNDLLAAIKRGAEFYLPDKLTKGEEAIRDFIIANKGKINKKQIKVSDFATSAKGNKLIYSPREDLFGDRLKYFKEWSEDKTIIKILKGEKQLRNEFIKDFEEIALKYSRGKDKFLPSFAKEKASEISTSFQQVEKLYSDIASISERSAVKEQWEKAVELGIKNYRDNLLNDLNELTGGKPSKWQLDDLNAKVKKVEVVTRLVSEQVFQFDKPERFFEGIKRRIGEIIFNNSFLDGSESDPNLSRFVDAIQDPRINIGPDFFTKLPNDLILYKAYNWLLDKTSLVRGFVRVLQGDALKLWIYCVLFLRPGWGLWNSLGDSMRAAMAARSFKLFLDMNSVYLLTAATFIKEAVSDLARFVTDSFVDVSKRKYKVFTMDDYLAKARVSWWDKVWRNIGGGKAENAWMLKYGKRTTPFGELLDPEMVDFITGDGLFSINTDPVASAAKLKIMKRQGYFKNIGNSDTVIKAYFERFAGKGDAIYNRIKTRGYVIKGHLENFNSHMEEMRRLLLTQDLIFRKGFSIAEAELVIKKWMFDYRDLSKAGQLMRKFFPFYAYTSKMIGLYLDTCAKLGPGVWAAAGILLDAMEEASADMPDQYKERINFGGRTWWLLNFGILDPASVLRDPSSTIIDMINNPSRAPFGLGWNPFISAGIKLYTGKGYYDSGWENKDFDGWLNEEVDKFKTTEDGKLIDKLSWSTSFDDILTVIFMFCPPLEVLEQLFEIDIKSQVRDIRWYESKKVRIIFKQLGLNFLVYDEIEDAWDKLFNMPPWTREYYKGQLREEDPELWNYMRDYSIMNKSKKIIEAEGKDKEKLQQDFFRTYIIDQYYDLESQEKGAGGKWIERNPDLKKIMEDYWKEFNIEGTKTYGQLTYDIGVLKGTIRELLGDVKSADSTRIQKMNAAGIKHPFSKPFDEQAMYKELYDENNNLKIKNIEDLFVIAQKYGLVDKIEDLEQLMRDVTLGYTDYKMLTEKAKEEGKKEDAEYYRAMGMLSVIIPKNIDRLSEEEASKYWDEWNKLKKTLIDSNPKFKARYEADTPDWLKEYYAKNTEYISLWAEIINKPIDGTFDYFRRFYSQPRWFQDWYFLKHPNYAVYYPLRLQAEKIMAKNISGKFDEAIYKEYLDYIWNNQSALKAWDKDTPGQYNFIDKTRQVYDKTVDESMDYFERFYQNPGDKDWDDFREFFFNKPGNEYKRITYPFTQKWVALIALDAENQKKDKVSDLSGDWFWSPKNDEARRLYGENKPIDDKHNAVDYMKVWRDLQPKMKEDPGIIYGFVLNSEPWFKNHYFSKHPDREIYYPLALKMQDAGFDGSNALFFANENKAIIEAWERDKPGTIAYRKFWMDISKIKDRNAYYDYFFSESNKEFRDRYEANNPGAVKAYTLAREYYKLDSNSWEDRKARRQFLKENPELSAWWARNKTEKDIAMELKANAYYDIIDSIEADGSGREYVANYFTKKALAQKYLNDNPDLTSFWNSNKKEATGYQAVINKLLEEYNTLITDEDKSEFLKVNQELDQFFLNSIPPGIRKLRMLERMYFTFTDQDQRKSFLQNYPQLVEYWEIKRLPTSFFVNYSSFKPYQDSYNQAKKYFDAVKAGDWVLAETFRTSFPPAPDLRTEEGRWLLSKFYNDAMAAWVTTFGSTWSTYYFRSLPDYIRTEYFRRHPNSKMLSLFSIERIMEEGYRRTAASAPDLNYAYAMQRKYGKDMPFEIKQKVSQIFLKYKKWEDRSNWTKRQWDDWWMERVAKSNNMLLKDMEKIPLLRIAAQRIAKTYSYAATIPKPLRKYGLINPFFGNEQDFKLSRNIYARQRW